MSKEKPVTVICTTPFKHDGEHIAVGAVMKDMEPELAKELAGAGRVRLHTAADAAGKKNEKTDKVPA